MAMGLPFLALRKIAFDCANLSSHDPPTVSLSLCVARLKRDGRYIFEPWMKPVEMKRYPRKTSKGGFVDPVKTNVSRAMMSTENGLGPCTQVCCGAQADDSFSALAASKFHSDAGLSGF